MIRAKILSAKEIEWLIKACDTRPYVDLGDGFCPFTDCPLHDECYDLYLSEKEKEK